MLTRSVLALSIIAVLNIPAPISAQSSNQRSAVYDFAAGQHIRMDLGAGEYDIRGVSDEKIRVVWTGDKIKDVERVKVDFKAERGGVRLETDRTKDVRIRIEIPARSNLRVELSAGELTISGIEGDKDIEMTAGELRVNVGDPDSYRDVSSSVSIGEINARAFNVSKDGFFRGFQHLGTGKYSLRANVRVGEVTLTR
jgi:hypothetical protein